MKTVTICGSMRYAKEMKQVALDLEIHHGFNVLQCVYNPQNLTLSNIEKEALERAHYKKIDLSDIIYVLDIDGYIGESVKKEIEYAKKTEKEVIYHTQFRN